MSRSPASCACGWGSPAGERPARCPACGAQLGAARALRGEFGPYELLERIGAGAMGQVFRARDRRQGREVALKLLLASETNEKQRGRLQREGRALARVQHPNLVEFHEAGEHEGRLFVAMELVVGTSLAERTRTQPIASDEALRLCAQLARALGALHAAGVVHRDVKPANVLLDPRGAARLVDLGLARGEALGQTRLTRTGALVGTPHYMAPEQFGAEKELGPAADVYALGSLLYELLVGRPPFLQDNLLALAGAVANETPDPPSRHGAEIPAEVDALVLRMLAKDPAERPPDGAAAADELEALLAPKAKAGPAPLLAFVVLGAFGFGLGASLERERGAARRASPTTEASAPAALPPASPRPSPGVPVTLEQAEAALGVAAAGSATVAAEQALIAALEGRRSRGEATPAQEQRLFELQDRLGTRAAEDLGRELLEGDLDAETRGWILGRLYPELIHSGREAREWASAQLARLTGEGPGVCLARGVAAAYGDLSESLTQCRNGLSQAPGDPALLLQLAETLISLERREEAKAALRELERCTDSRAWIARARLSLAMLDRSRSEELAEEALRIYPAPFVSDQAAQLALLRADTARALELFRLALAQGRSYRFVSAPIFRDLLFQARWEELREATQRELARDPSWELAIRYGALAELWLGRPGAGLLVLARGVRASRGQQARRLSWHLATAARGLGDWGAAGRELRSYVDEQLPDSELGVLLGAYEAESRGDAEASLQVLRGGGPSSLRRLAEFELRLPRSSRAAMADLLSGLSAAAQATSDPWLLSLLSVLHPEPRGKRELSRRAYGMCRGQPRGLTSEVYATRHAVLSAYGTPQVFDAFHQRIDQRLWQLREELFPLDLALLSRSLCVAWKRFKPDLRQDSTDYHSTALIGLRLAPWSWVSFETLAASFPTFRQRQRYLQGCYLPILGPSSHLADLTRLALARLNLQGGFEQTAAVYLDATRLRAKGSWLHQSMRARMLFGLGFPAEGKRQLEEVLREAPRFSAARRFREDTRGKR